MNDSALALRDDLWKFTVTPQVSVENVFFSRPVIYAYATCAAWGDGFKGRIGGNDTLNRLDGRAFGMQLETRCCESPCVRRSIRLNSEM